MSEKDKNEQNNTTNSDQEGVDEGRRKFIKNTGLVAGGVVGGSLLGGFFVDMFDSDETATNSVKDEKKSFREARMFFTRKEDFDVLEAATERIFPKDDNGPGAIELGVPYFIDSQLAGEFGSNAKEYMQGPFKDAKNSDRYETIMSRGEMFIEGLRTMNKYSQKKFDDKFPNTDEKNQDKIIQALEDGKIKIHGVSSEMFFSLLRQMTIEGAYADPLYGGNKDMQGWKMREYPGAQSAYINDIESDEFVELDPISLRDYMP